MVGEVIIQKITQVSSLKIPTVDILIMLSIINILGN